MKMLVQRVKHAKVTVDGNVTGAIKQGYLVLLGIAPEDTTEIMEKMVDKLLRLRIFSDENDKINLSLQDVGGSLLLVSQFTLYADCRKGTAPVLCTRHRRHRRKPLCGMQGVLSGTGACGGIWHIRGRYAGGTVQRRTVHRSAGFRRNHQELRQYRTSLPFSTAFT